MMNFETIAETVKIRKPVETLSRSGNNSAAIASKPVKSRKYARK